MKIGVPKGLLYYNYYPFIEKFLYEIGGEIITSGDTNKEILNEGVKHCVDEACLPIKVFHGHVYSIKDKCDFMVIPRIMKMKDSKFICPKFCALPEMIENSITDMPEVTKFPLYLSSDKSLYTWCKKLGSKITRNHSKINKAFEEALYVQKNFRREFKDKGYTMKIALIGHPYNLYDNFINMNIVSKLHKLGAGIITEEYVSEQNIDFQVKKLFKKPFWSFARTSYGASVCLAENKEVDGIIYMSSFACGIDSVVIELIKNEIGNFPFMVLKIDEQTGEAGFDTRVEAFVDMIERRKKIENNMSSYGQYIHCS